MDGSGDLVLRVTVCFSEDQGSVPNTHIGWLTAACNSSFRGSDAFWRLCGINTHGYHLGFLFLFFFFNEGLEGWLRACAALSKNLRFLSKHPHGGLQTSIIPV